MHVYMSVCARAVPVLLLTLLLDTVTYHPPVVQYHLGCCVPLKPDSASNVDNVY